jgi:type IV pilus assembly protein PilE
MRNGEQGFTLIELMVAVAIVGLLAALAYPTFMDSVRKARRTDAKAELMNTAHDLERCFTQFMAYDSASCSVVGEISGGNKRTSEEGFYEVVGTLNATTYALVATAPVGGAQASDPTCATLNLNSQNAKTPAACW